MDGHQFDTFTRLLAKGGSRRRLLRTIGGLGAGLLVGAGRTALAAADHCGLLGSTCELDGRPCCPGFDCNPDTLTCQGACASLTDPCANDGECCPDLFCIEGACGRPSQCTEFFQPCTSSDECCGTQFGPGFCSSQGTCAACSPEDGSCGSTAECCPGLGLQCSFGTCQPCAAEGESCAFNGCCSGLSCLEGQICGVPAPTCSEEGEACDENAICCNDLPCNRGICNGPDCASEGQICGDSDECCGDLICGDGGECVATCLGAGTTCDADPDGCCGGLACVAGVCATLCLGVGESCANDPDGCCGGLMCTEGVCAPPAGGAATITIHKATCPSGVGPDIFASCHDNVLAGVGFSINGAGVVTGGNGAAAASGEAGPVTVTEDADTFAAYLGTYVYCAEQGSGTVLYDGSADRGSVTFTVADSDDVLCDWYNLTEADDDDGDDGGSNSTSGGTTLPTTGVGSGAGATGDTKGWMGAALIGGAAAILAGTKLRDTTVPPETVD